MRHPDRHQLRPIAATLAAVVALLLVAGSASAKEGLEARLDAPIPMGTPGGTELLVGVTVSVLDETGYHPVEGSPVYLRLIGRDGSSTRAAGAAEGQPGHYVMRIAIPEGGAREIEIGLHGTSDLAMIIMEDPFTFGDVRPGTAQVAPPLPPALTPAPRAAAPAPVATAAPVPAADPAATADPGLSSPFLVALAIAGVGATVGGLVLARRRRGLEAGRRGASAPRSA